MRFFQPQRYVVLHILLSMIKSLWMSFKTYRLTAVSYTHLHGTKRVENMRTEELIERISKHEPLVAKAVSHMVAYVQDRYPSTFPSKEQTMAVNEYLHSVHADGDGSICLLYTSIMALRALPVCSVAVYPQPTVLKKVVLYTKPSRR